jgi:ABC-type thiamine transport system substrate-binding protein
VNSARRSAWLLVCKFAFGAVLLSGPLLRSRLAHAAAQPVLSIYTYDSLIAAGGLGPEIFPEFEKSCGCRLKVVAIGDGGQLLNRLELDARQGRRSAAVVLGPPIR